MDFSMICPSHINNNDWQSESGGWCFGVFGQMNIIDFNA